MTKELTPLQKQQLTVERLIDAFKIKYAKADSAVAEAELAKCQLERAQRKLEGLK